MSASVVFSSGHVCKRAAHSFLTLHAHRQSGSRRNSQSSAVLQTGLLSKRCIPCEEDRGSLRFMGICESMDRSKAESLIASEAEGWELAENEQKHLKIQRTFRTKNFVKALELCNRIGEVAEAEGHHPDLHITRWNRLTVELTTHSRDGLTENDFIMAAKLNAVPKEDLLSKKKA